MRVVIVGAGYAGLACALRLARRSRGRADIVLVSGSNQLVERIRLHEQAAGELPRPLPLETLLRGTGVRLRIGWVEAIDLEHETVRVSGESLPFDRLVLATGSQTDVDAVPGVRAHAHTLDAASMGALGATLPAIAARGGRVVVVGGGLTGIEAASELAERAPTLAVELVTRGALAPSFSPRARDHARAVLRRLGVAVREHVDVHSVAANALHTADGVTPFDACIWSVGFRASPLAAESGLSVNARGQAVTDAMLRATSHPFVYVAGDLAAPQGMHALPMGCKTALPTGLHVAENLARSLAGRPEQALSAPFYAYCVSLGRRDGLIEAPARDGRAPRVLTGRLAARFKELVCRATLWGLALERRLAALAVRASTPPRLLPSMVERTTR